MPIQYFEPDTKLDKVLQAIREDGAAVLIDAAEKKAIKKFESELKPFLVASPYGRDNFSGKLTRRVGALIARTPSSRNFIVDKRILYLARKFLAKYTEKITLHLTQATTIYPHSEAQFIHRDRFAWGTHIPKEIEPQFNSLWAITDFNIENGATKLIPGSQNWAWDRQAQNDEIDTIEMSKGSVLLYTGSVLHGGGENISDRPRTGLNLTYCLAWLRQQENQFLSCPPHIAKTLDEELQELVGYTQGSYGLGYFSDPENVAKEFDIMVPELALGRGPRHKAHFNTDQLSKVEKRKIL